MTAVSLKIDHSKDVKLEVKSQGTAVDSKTKLHFVTWNLDRVNASKWKRVTDFLTHECPDVFCINEIKMSGEKLIKEYLLGVVDKYEYIVNSHFPAQHHGVAVLIKKGIHYENLQLSLSCPPRADNRSTTAETGRVIVVKIANRINLVSCYTPNAGTALKYLKYRTGSWDPAFYAMLENLKKDKPTIWLGDINVAAAEIDVTHPDEMRGWSGFTNEERKNHNDFLSSGWVDIWRFNKPKEPGYTWHSRGGKANMRLDAAIIDKANINIISDIAIIPFIDSDHSGISVKVEL